MKHKVDDTTAQYLESYFLCNVSCIEVRTSFSRSTCISCIQVCNQR